MPAVAPEPNYFGRQLLRLLRELREKNRMTQEEAGERVRIGFKKLSRIERRQLPTYHELVMLLDIYGVLSCDYGPYIEMWEKAKTKAWWRRLGIADTRYIRMEDEADTKIEFQLGLIPTLLQTEQYARHTLTDHSTSMAKKLVEVRMRQQERLTTQPSLTLRALIHEPVLYQAIDREQLDKLIQMAELPTVTIRVVPQDRIHLGLHGGLVLLTFDDPHEPDSAFSETLLGLQESQASEHIHKIRSTLEDITRHSKTPGDSLQQLHALRNTYL
ncbi:helix-turn-helix domain-containing protein [Kibdelosporangium aridum]|nr:helix-turn-helix transcriptional regulator [Kibdelosporangium aridum]